MGRLSRFRSYLTSHAGGLDDGFRGRVKREAGTSPSVIGAR